MTTLLFLVVIEDFMTGRWTCVVDAPDSRSAVLKAIESFYGQRSPDIASLKFDIAVKALPPIVR